MSNNDKNKIIKEILNDINNKETVDKMKEKKITVEINKDFIIKLDNTFEKNKSKIEELEIDKEVEIDKKIEIDKDVEIDKEVEIDNILKKSKSKISKEDIVYKEEKHITPNSTSSEGCSSKSSKSSYYINSDEDKLVIHLDDKHEICFEKLKINIETQQSSDDSSAEKELKYEEDNKKIIFRRTPTLFLVYDKIDNLYEIYIKILKHIKLKTNIHSLNFINLIVKIIEYIDKNLKIEMCIQEKKDIVMNIIELWIKINMQNVDERNTMLGLMNKLVPSTIEIMVDNNKKKCSCCCLCF